MDRSLDRRTAGARAACNVAVAAQSAPGQPSAAQRAAHGNKVAMLGERPVNFTMAAGPTLGPDTGPDWRFRFAVLFPR